MEQKLNRNSIPVILMLLFMFLVGLLSYWNMQKNDEARSKDLVIEALTNKMKKTVNSLGQETAEKNLYMLSYKSLQKVRASDSSEIGRLKKLVTKNTIAATIIKTTTSGTLTGKPDIVFKNDSSRLAEYGAPCDTIYPEYKDTLRDGWAEIDVTMNKDTSIVQYQVKNEYEYLQEWQKQGKFPFRYKAPVAKITNKNPHTRTDEIVPFVMQVPNNKKQNTVIGGIALFVGFVLGVVIAK